MELHLKEGLVCFNLQCLLDFETPQENRCEVLLGLIKDIKANNYDVCMITTSIKEDYYPRTLEVVTNFLTDLGIPEESHFYGFEKDVWKDITPLLREMTGYASKNQFIVDNSPTRIMIAARTGATGILHEKGKTTRSVLQNVIFA